jgi:hypothetical protein
MSQVLKLDFKIIAGPVNFLYLNGNVGDDIERKVLLLGDYFQSKCTGESTIEVADFYHYIASRVSPLDVIIPVPHQKETSYHLQKLYDSFEHCLSKKCINTIKVHYIDVNKIAPDLLSFNAIGLLLDHVKQSNTPSFTEWDIIKWPAVSERKEAANISLADAGISQERMSKVASEIESKIMDKVVRPLYLRLIEFYNTRNNEDEFNQIRDIASHVDTSRTKKELAVITSFENKFSSLQAYFMDVYFVLRILRQNKPMTHILSYMDWSHLFRIRNILLEIGFSVEGEGDRNNLENRSVSGKVKPIFSTSKPISQCLNYDSIKYTVDAFCSEEEESEIEESEIEESERRELEEELQIKLEEVTIQIQEMEEEKKRILSRLSDIREYRG